jgi:site-specific DNA-methyltransferase (adenine-specific)
MSDQQFKNVGCIELMGGMQNGSIDLVFADPPFNIGYKYDKYKDTKESEEYVEWSKEWISQCHRVLKPSGSIWVAIGDEYAAEICVILKSLFNMRNWVIWHYTFGNNCKTKFGRCHAHLLYFTKCNTFTFNADDIRIESERQKIGDKRANSKGKIPSDVWTFPRICGTFKERCGWHPCQMPLSILERIVLTSSNVGDTILDPFGGSGTTAIACEKLGRNSISCDISSEYCQKAQDRLNEFKKENHAK